MAKVLIVSRNPAMAMGLASTDYDVTELRPPAFGPWIDGDDDADALILDLDSPALAAAAVTNLRAHGKRAPVLLVSSDRPGWDTDEMRGLPSATVLPLPINRPSLVAALDEMLVAAASPTVAKAPAPTPEPQLDRSQEAPVGESQVLAAQLGERSDEPHESDEVSDPEDEAAVAHFEEVAEELQQALREARHRREPVSAVNDENDAAPTSGEEAETRHDEVADALRELVLDPADLLPDDDDLDSRIAAPPPQAEPPPEYHAPAIYDPLSDRPTPTPTRTRKSTQERVRARTTKARPAENQPAAPPLSAVPRTRRTANLPTAPSAGARNDLEALRPTAREPRSTSGDRAPTKRRRTPARQGPTATDAPPAPAEQVKLRDDPIDLVQRLARLTGSLYGVPETADVIIGDAVESTRAEAGALLVPDDGAWRVAAGLGLRPLESRYELHEESWLVQEVARAHKGAIVEESDIAREQLQGAPLASWRHLLAAPVPQVEALFVLARREDPPFTEDDLTVLARIGSEAGPLLASAMDTRSLARALWEFRDEADLPR